MANPTVLGGRVLENVDAARAVVEAHGSEDRRQRIAGYYGRVPMPNRDPFAYAAYQSELLAGLAEIVEGLLTPTAAATTAKRGPGRPRKEQS